MPLTGAAISARVALNSETGSANNGDASPGGSGTTDLLANVTGLINALIGAPGGASAGTSGSSAGALGGLTSRK
ncbi:hypothetical protein [Paraburkholderia nemoris]|uniref:hypothetical protein n=1 Tax=Paraburkholderia nemoris TaxID=2793076 RepID=UPI001B8D61EE|nr:hypothetical protein [Paraburkholderia nemoris]